MDIMLDSTMTTVGTLGWLAVLVFEALRRRCYAEVIVRFVFFISIVDLWAVAPLAFKNHGWSTNWLWIPVLLPYALLLRWSVEFVRCRGEQAGSE